MPSIESLPAELLQMIVDLFLPWEIKAFSCVSRRLRQACLPSLFHRIGAEFSLAGFETLKSLLTSDVRHHAVSFSYTVPALVNSGVLDFDTYTRDILTRELSAEIAKDLCDAGRDADEYPPYMDIYQDLNVICQEQRDIIDRGIDSLILSQTLKALPHLTEVELIFDHPFAYENWFLPAMAREENSWEYHIRLLSNVIESARGDGVNIKKISFRGFCFIYGLRREIQDLKPLSDSLVSLLQDVPVLRLTGSRDIVWLLSKCPLTIQRLDICGLICEEHILKEFLGTNKSIQSVGLHDITVYSLDQHPAEFLSFSPAMLCSFLDLPRSTTSGEADCGCVPFRKEGWRVSLKEGISTCDRITVAKH